MSPNPFEVFADAQAGQLAGDALRMPKALGARLANLMYTAQVQMAYGCASQTREGAERSIARITQEWPDTPLRTLILDAYRAQARSADAMAQQLLQGARQHCGLAFAQL